MLHVVFLLLVLMGSCVIWTSAVNTGGRGDWSNEGCSNATMNDELRDQDVVICKCNHLSTFGIFVVRLNRLSLGFCLIFAW